MPEPPIGRQLVIARPRRGRRLEQLLGPVPVLSSRDRRVWDRLLGVRAVALLVTAFVAVISRLPVRGPGPHARAAVADTLYFVLLAPFPPD